VLTGLPTDATVQVDDNPAQLLPRKGSESAQVQVAAGKRDVVVRKKGMVDWRQSVEVKPNESTRISVVLRPAQLEDLLKPGVKIQGTWSFTTRKLDGQFTLTIRKRSGNRFEAWYKAAAVNAPPLEWPVEGTVKGNSISFTSIAETKGFRVSGSKKGRDVNLIFTSWDKHRAIMKARITGN
jgi:hypothetical protein